ncbi:MAG: hypothetical protein AVDCRST_MAG07-506, partial [uncultured Frankineae bacterium]
ELLVVPHPRSGRGVGDRRRGLPQHGPPRALHHARAGGRRARPRPQPHGRQRRPRRGRGRLGAAL